jgi:hypothetical protein
VQRCDDFVLNIAGAYQFADRRIAFRRRLSRLDCLCFKQCRFPSEIELSPRVRRKV